MEKEAKRNMTYLDVAQSGQSGWFGARRSEVRILPSRPKNNMMTSLGGGLRSSHPLKSETSSPNRIGRPLNIDVGTA